MNIALIDDDKEEINHMKELLLAFEKQNGLSFFIDCFSNAEVFIKKFEEYKYSVIFADIFMNGMDGMKMAKLIREKDNNCFIVFITNSDAFMPQAFSCHAFQYIQKPTTKKHIFQVLTDIVKFIPNLQRYIEFSYNRQIIKMMFSEIICINANRHNSNITNKNGITFSPNIGFSKFIKPLIDDKRFLIINRGILVNMDYITGFDKNTCHLIKNINLPVRVREYSKIERIWQNYMFNQIHMRLTIGDK